MRAADAFGAWNPSSVVQESDRNGGDVRTMLPEFRPPDQVPKPGFSPLAAYSGSAGSGTRRPLRKLMPRPPPGPQLPVPQQQQQQPVPQPLTFGESAGSAPSDPPSSSTLSYERSTASSTASRGGGGTTKRSRKRSKAEPPLPPRACPAPPRLQPMPPEHLEMPSSSLQTVGPIALGNSPYGPRVPMEQHFRWERPSSQTPLAPIPFGGFSPMQLAGGPRMPTAYVNEVASAESGPALNGGEGAGTSGRIDRRYYGHGFGSFRFPYEAGLPAMSGTLPDMHVPSINVSADGEGSSSFMDRAAAASAPPHFLEREAHGLQRARSAAGGGGGGAGGAAGAAGAAGGAGGAAGGAAGVGLTSGNFEVFQNGAEPGGVLSRGISGTTSCTSITTSGPSPTTEVREDPMRSNTPAAGVANHHLSTSGSGSGSMVGEVIPDDADRTGELVTLSLLPNTPSYEKTSTEVVRPTSLQPNASDFLTLRMGCDSRHWDAAAAAPREDILAAGVESSGLDLAKLDLFNGAYDQQRQQRQQQDGKAAEAAVVEPRSTQVAGAHRDSFGESSSAAENSLDKVLSDWPSLIDKVARGVPPIFRQDANEDSSKAAATHTAVVDVAYLEEKYSGNEPMILEDQKTGAHLWENQAYKKKVEAKAKRKAGALYMDMDPLGSRYRKDAFQFRRPDGSVVNAVLLGSLTKFMRLDVEELDKNDSPPQQQQHAHPSPVHQNITLQLAADQKDAIPKGVQGSTSHQISRPVPRRPSDV